MSVSGPTTDHSEIRGWAAQHHARPAEVLPQRLDSEPAVLRFMFPGQARDHQDIRLISWEEFFVKFDELGLSFVYDTDSTGYNELLQVEERSPYRRFAGGSVDETN